MTQQAQIKEKENKIKWYFDAWFDCAKYKIKLN